MKTYEIWLGWYHLGQGSHPPKEPEMVGTAQATSFKIACFLYELKFAFDSIQERMRRGDTYIEDMHFGRLDYDPKTNSNGWTGKYFESREEALQTFH